MKNKWYKSKTAKAVLVPVAIASMTAALVSGFWLLSAGWEAEEVPFEESEDFEAMMENAMMHVVSLDRFGKLFETDGEYDPEKTVDIMEYCSSGDFSGQNEAGLTYTLGDLYEWGQRGLEHKESYIIECEKPNGESYYYYPDDFERLVENRELFLDLKSSSGAVSGYSDEDFLYELRNGFISEGAGLYSVTDIEGNVIYTSVWSAVNEITEDYETADGKSLLDAVNGSAYLRDYGIGRIIDNLSHTLMNIPARLDEYLNGDDVLGEGNTNFIYIYTDSANGEVMTNREAYQDRKALQDSISAITDGDPVIKYIIVYPQLEDFKTNIDNISAEYFRNLVKNNAGDDWNGVFAAAVDTSYPIQDSFFLAKQTYDQNLGYMNTFKTIVIIAGVIAIVSLVWLTVIAGRRAEDDEIHLNWFDRWKTEIAAAFVIAVGVLIFVIFGATWSRTGVDSAVVEASYAYGYDDSYRILSGMTSVYIGTRAMATLITAAVCGSAFFYAGYLSLVRRIKAKILWKNSLIRALGIFIGKTWANRSVTAKSIGLLAGFVVLHWIAMVTWFNMFWVIVMLIADGAMLWLVVNNAIAKRKIKEGIERIASGDINYQIPTADMRGDNLATAEKVNEIGNGLNLALENVLKSERMKADLITNVSHDIKTPLTSIINYIDLLKRENIEDEKIQKYLKVLEEKAQRLKTLTEDVVEASKASSGNINLELMDVDFAEMIQQTEGEFEEKLSARNLTVVSKLPEQPVIIHVDGRRMWRVLANLYSNVVKYAMPGTRVYTELKALDGKAVFSIKNISEQPLNIPVEELKERFIRGDQARTSEGSGLGLSIAEDLVKLQGGKLELYLDGDLFKVEVEFECVVKNATPDEHETRSNS
ncbi:MAG TPA: HAMP domain-containing histidine kinase [Candidatus Alectryocaccobium stercorigallinarum]|nr:HAMP domain-containing histidine kinase [Candidatus Alectryocaccobium stercorigallinarum]